MCLSSANGRKPHALTGVSRTSRSSDCPAGSAGESQRQWSWRFAKILAKPPGCTSGAARRKHWGHFLSHELLCSLVSGGETHFWKSANVGTGRLGSLAESESKGVRGFSQKTSLKSATPIFFQCSCLTIPPNPNRGSPGEQSRAWCARRSRELG